MVVGRKIIRVHRNLVYCHSSLRVGVLPVVGGGVVFDLGISVSIGEGSTEPTQAGDDCCRDGTLVV